MLGINLKRILIVSFLNYYIKKGIKEFDLFISDSKSFHSSDIYTCNKCNSVISSLYIVYKANNISCPYCNSKLDLLDTDYLVSDNRTTSEGKI